MNNPYHYPKQGGRPPHSHIKERVFDILKSMAEEEKDKEFPMIALKPQDVQKKYRAKWKKNPDLKTIKKYLQILTDEKMLKATLLTDNKSKNAKKRWRQYIYEYNLEI